MYEIGTFIFVVAVLMELDRYLESRRKYGQNR